MAATGLRRFTYNTFSQKGSTAEEGVRIWAINSTGGVVIDSTTDSSGKIPATLVEVASYSISDFTTTITDRNPFNIRSLKYGLEVQSISQSLSSSSTGNAFFETDNANVTEATKATVAAYNGTSVAHATSTGLITSTTGAAQQIDTIDELYDYLQVEAVDNPQTLTTLAEIMATVDGQNYTLQYSWLVNNIPFDGQNRAVAFSTGQKLIIQSTLGNVTDLAVTGDVDLETGTSETNLTNLDITGTLDFLVGAGERAVNNCQIGTVFSTSSGVILNLLGDSQITTNASTDNITINNAVELRIKIVDQSNIAIENARVAIYESTNISSDAALMNKLTDSSGVALESYNYLADQSVVVRARKSSAGDDPKYEPASVPQIITSAGLNITLPLSVDPNNNA